MLLSRFGPAKVGAFAYDPACRKRKLRLSEGKGWSLRLRRLQLTPWGTSLPLAGSRFYQRPSVTPSHLWRRWFNVFQVYAAFLQCAQDVVQEQWNPVRMVF